jgi:hypothetical protein
MPRIGDLNPGWVGLLGMRAEGRAGLRWTSATRTETCRLDSVMKGDRIEILVDVGDAVRSFEIVATKAGRRVEATVVRGTVEVLEITRTGQPVRSARFMASRVVALVEYPSMEEAEEE